MKYICKDFWTAVYKKQIDNLRTNHQVKLMVLKVFNLANLYHFPTFPQKNLFHFEVSLDICEWLKVRGERAMVRL